MNMKQQGYASLMPIGPFSSEEARALQTLALGHPIIAPILAKWPRLGLPDAWLSGSIMAQARWNEAFGLNPLHGIADADIIYFDPTDTSAEEEERTAARIAAILADTPIRIDTKNQARVHQWYARKFGYDIAPYRSSTEALTTFPTTAAAVGIRCESRFEIAAPFGLADLLLPLVRANATQITPATYAAKAARWQMFWPDLRILPWDEAASYDACHGGER
ncbi:nucleotidyltransferase family protein [Sphingobium aquiterrae]|uniref:nucleotidyltransferase family protein n=1 Tax=Sphingobium aquiterrae TaxID=2038656 RepID=UPI00301A07B9